MQAYNYTRAKLSRKNYVIRKYYPRNHFKEELKWALYARKKFDFLRTLQIAKIDFVKRITRIFKKTLPARLTRSPVFLFNLFYLNFVEDFRSDSGLNNIKAFYN